MTDRLCVCGWRLPWIASAFPVDKEPDATSVIPNSYVAMLCPECKREHRNFETPEEAERHTRMYGVRYLGERTN